MSLEITFSELWTYSLDDVDRRLPVSALPEDGLGHIHGRLQIAVAGRVVPHMGYCGPTDVCFGQWLQVLHKAVNSLGTSSGSEYVFDEGEECQPAFRWVRKDAAVLFSIVDSVLSAGEADPAWQDIEFRFADFLREVKDLEVRFEATLLSEAPVGGAAWLANLKPDAA
jgi:hypothetical protein